MNAPNGSRSSRVRGSILLRGFLLFAFAATITMVNQYWVGNATIYQGGELAERRAEFHTAIVENDPPGETWSEDGANGINIRIGAVYIAELASRVSGAPLGTTYQVLDTLYLYGNVVLLFWFLSLTSGALGGVLGTLYFGTILPLTYFLYFFHPWDRISLLFWILALVALFKDRTWLFLLLILLGIPVKYDIMILPGLYFLAKVRPDDWLKPTAYTFGMLVATFSTYLLLRAVFPGGFEAGVTTLQQLGTNLGHFLARPMAYQPLLALGLPFVLGVVGFPRGSRWERACFGFSLILMTAIFLRANFREVRALMPALVLMLPLAIHGFSRMAEESGMFASFRSTGGSQIAPESGSASR